MHTDPHFTDGRSAILNPLVECLNIPGDGTTYQRYEYLSDGIDREPVEKEHSDADGSPLGSDTREGFEKGPINLQTTKASHKLPRPGHIIHLNIGEGDEYYIAGKAGRSRERNNIKRGAVAVKRCYNPIVDNLLSEEYGQRKTATHASGAAYGLTATAVNVRTGGVKTWSLVDAPALMTIGSATGIIAWPVPLAGTYEIQVVCNETLAGQETREGFGVLALTVT